MSKINGESAFCAKAMDFSEILCYFIAVKINDEF